MHYFTLHKSSSSFKIQFQTNSEALVKSLLHTHLILGGTTNEDYTSITFKANSIISYDTFSKSRISIRQSLQLLKTMLVQLDYLIKHQSNTILLYDPDNILILDNQTMIYVGNTEVFDIQTEKVMVCTPFSKNEQFISPELKSLTELPSFIHFKSAYYSLALCISYLLKKDEYIHHPVKNTKLYWFLSRCLIEDPLSRSIVLI